MKERTPKQKWHFERRFQNKGTLAGAVSAIRTVANSSSTLPHEKENLMSVVQMLKRSIDGWRRWEAESETIYMTRNKYEV